MPKIAWQKWHKFLSERLWAVHESSFATSCLSISWVRELALLQLASGIWTCGGDQMELMEGEAAEEAEVTDAGTEESLLSLDWVKQQGGVLAELVT